MDKWEYQTIPCYLENRAVREPGKWRTACTFKTKWQIFSNFCGLLKISELYCQRFNEKKIRTIAFSPNYIPKYNIIQKQNIVNELIQHIAFYSFIFLWWFSVITPTKLDFLKENKNGCLTVNAKTVCLNYKKVELQIKA